MQICRVSYGGVTLNDLERMPYVKYIALRKAAEMEELAQRITLISDINAAFSGNREHMKKLEHGYDNLSGFGRINWKKDADWEKRLGRFKR